MDWHSSEAIKKDITIQSGAAHLKAFLARPDNSLQNPAVVVIHEITGLSDHIKDVCCRLTEEGYVALALDLFSPGHAAVCILRCMAAVRSGKTDHFAVEYLQSALDYLSDQSYVDSVRLGAIGFCMGGNFSLSLACTDSRVKTIAPFYGLTPRELDAAKLCPTVGSYPELDLTRQAGEQLQATLDKTSTAHDIKIYPGSFHCFMNDRLPFLYNDEAAKDSWKRTLDFFDQHLKRADFGLPSPR